MRRPTTIVTCVDNKEGRALFALHPSIGSCPVYNFGRDQPPGGFPFLSPGEGPWKVWPAVKIGQFDDRGDPRARMNATVEAASVLALTLQRTALAPPIIWDLGGGFSGVLAIGIARALGRAVCVAPDKPDRLAIALADNHGVQLMASYSLAERVAATSFLGGF